MVDGQRVYPVQYFFLHHSTGPDFVNAEDIEVQDWYSVTGKARAYQNGAINPMHEHPSRPGQLTYAQAQFTLREYGRDNNKYGYRLTDLMNNPWANVAWAVGDWWYNQRSSSVEVCGNFLNKVLPDKALMCIADFLRIIDNELIAAGYKDGIILLLHQEVYATACPGRIKEQRDKIVDMINNPAKWNNILWPPAPPKPVITTAEEVNKIKVPYDSEEVNNPQLPVGTRRVVQTGVDGEKTITYTVTYTDGKETNRVIKSETVTTQPVKEIIHVGTLVQSSKDDEQDRRLDALEAFKELLKAAWRKIFNRDVGE